MIYYSHYSSPIGPISLAANEKGLCGLWFDGQKYFKGAIRNEQIEDCALDGFNAPKALKDAAAWLDIYFSGGIPNFTPVLDLQGSDFRKKVWNILLSIPYGKTITYGEIARRIASEAGFARMSAQAVGGAVGHNPISIIVPCHRVLGSDGSLTGYAGGTRRKEWLLKNEKIEWNKVCR
ncbi:MAG: methylated-DNA--[protein]-cysteine S-methyltransferase [Bacteroidales bacterium]|nr:methylated-DNA--[protein]-cysteine S-methyltransferase [Bacteroidales bacterium]